MRCAPVRAVRPRTGARGSAHLGLELQRGTAGGRPWTVGDTATRAFPVASKAAIATGSSSRRWRTMCGKSKEKLRSAIRFHGKTPVVFLSPILRSHVSPPRHGNASRYGRIVRRYVSRLLPDHLRAVSDAPLEQHPVIPEHLHRHPEFDRHAAGFAVVGSLGELVFDHTIL